MNFFELKRPASLNLSLEEQRKKWMPQFFKAFSVVFLVYFSSYLIRQNMSSASAAMAKSLKINKTEIANMLVWYSVTYGIGKTLLGFIADRRNTKRLVSFLLILGGFCNVAIGSFFFTSMDTKTLMFTTSVFWGINGLVLSPGGPCAYSTIMRWQPRSKQATWLGRWNVSHNIGGAVAATLAAQVAVHWFGGKVEGYFIVPGLFAIAIGFWGMFFGKDDPLELGWDEAVTVWSEVEEEAERKEEAEEEKDGELSKIHLFLRYVIINPWVLLLAIANVFVYIIRMGIVTWVTYYAYIVLGHKITSSANLIIWFEVSAMVGSLTLGWLSDRIKGRRMLISGIVMLLTSTGILLYKNATSIQQLSVAMFVCGFFIFGPQLLIGVSVVKFVPKKAVAVANGVTGTFGYLVGDLLAKKWIEKSVNRETREGWSKMFMIMFICVVAGAVLMFIVATAEEKRIRKEAVLKKLKA
ncbi:MAG: MFS transporter [Lactobacillales bacterium]|jgi:OPA family hexose phosphate transport protein UhpT-like MFS transporter|nr:MFS transporter [Lactobacillales bacterium]